MRKGDYIASLGKQAASQRPEREAQLKAIGADIEKLHRALGEGSMSGIIQGHGTLTAKLEKYYGGLEVIIKGGVSPRTRQAYGCGGPWTKPRRC
jgi:hypothetical protein